MKPDERPRIVAHGVGTRDNALHDIASRAQGSHDLAVTLGCEAHRGPGGGDPQCVQRAGDAVQRFPFAALRATKSAVSTAFRKSL